MCTFLCTMPFEQLLLSCSKEWRGRRDSNPRPLP